MNKTDRQPRLLVIGSINMDLCMYGLQGLPAWGTTTFAGEYRYSAGGKGANQALACAKLGADTYMVGRIGHDENGERLMASLRSGLVHTDYIVCDPAESTGLATINMTAGGEYFSLYAPGANYALCMEDFERALTAVDPDMIVMQLEMPREVAYKILETGRTRQIPVFLDAGPAQSVPLERLQGAFVISPNEAETLALTGIDPSDEDRMRTAAQMIYQAASPAYVILKLGSRGSYIYSDSDAKLVPAYPVNAVDTTAAGDTFGAAFCVRYCQGEEPEEAVRFAGAAAAVCVTRKGGQPSIPTLEEATRFYEERRC